MGLEPIENGYAEAQEDGTDPVKFTRLDGMNAAYRQIIRDATR